MNARAHILDQLAGGARTNPTPCCTCGVNAHLTDARLCIACEREREHPQPDRHARLAATERAIEEADRRGRIEGMRAALQHLRMAEHAVDARIAIGGEIDRLEVRGTDQWPILTTARARLVEGEVEYGDASFNGPLGNTVDEIRQEIADVIGWACVLARKLDRLGQAVQKAEGGA